MTILVNGLPLVQIELKRRGVAIKEAFNQINRYQRDSFWAGSGLYEYAQIFIISNGTHTKYYSNTTRFKHIHEMEGRPAATWDFSSSRHRSSHRRGSGPVQRESCAGHPVALDRALAQRGAELHDVKIRGMNALWLPEIAKIPDAAQHFCWNSWAMMGDERKMQKLGMCYYAPLRYSVYIFQI